MSSSFSSSSVRPTASTGVPILFCDDYVKPVRRGKKKKTTPPPTFFLSVP